MSITNTGPTRLFVLGILAGGLHAAAFLQATDIPPADWPMFRQNLQNTAATGGNSGKDVSQLKPKWTFTTGGDVSARAAVVNGVVYFPDWDGNI